MQSKTLFSRQTRDCLPAIPLVTTHLTSNGLLAPRPSPLPPVRACDLLRQPPMLVPDCPQGRHDLTHGGSVGSDVVAQRRQLLTKASDTKQVGHLQKKKQGKDGGCVAPAVCSTEPSKSHVVRTVEPLVQVEVNTCIMYYQISSHLPIRVRQFIQSNPNPITPALLLMITFPTHP